MEQQTFPAPPVFSAWGFWAVMAGAIALLIVLIQIFGPSLDPQPSAATTIGEIAGEIKRSAWRSFLGMEQPVPEPVAPSIKDWLPLAGPTLGLVAIVLSLVSLIRRENWRFTLYGTGLGVSAIVFFFFWWVALLFIGAMILVAIIENIGDIFSF